MTRDLRGWLEPCDCKAGVLGGFPRRATVVAANKPALLVDAGDLVFQASPYDLLKLRLMLELMGKLGYAAVNVGRRETEFSKDELVRVAGESPVPLLSANLSDAEGKPVLPGHAVVESSGTRIALFGLVTRDSNPGQGLQVLPPAAALRSELGKLEGPVDFVVLLSALSAREMEALVAEEEGIDLILGGHIPRGSERLEELAGVPCFLVQGKGQYLGEVLLSIEEGEVRPVSGRRIVLGPKVPSEPVIEQRIHDFKVSLKELDLLGRRSAESPYLGSKACAACHGDAHGAWRLTKHARAVESLTPEKGRYDPQCLACHATAPGKGGYVSEEKTPEYAGVGCESCHGPCRSHANAPLPASRPKTTGRPRKTCLSCHESDHSRPFHLPERLRAIQHWGEGEEKKR